MRILFLATIAAAAGVVLMANAQDFPADELQNREIHRRAAEAVIWGLINTDLMIDPGDVERSAADECNVCGPLSLRLRAACSPDARDCLANAKKQHPVAKTEAKGLADVPRPQSVRPHRGDEGD